MEIEGLVLEKGPLQGLGSWPLEMYGPDARKSRQKLVSLRSNMAAGLAPSYGSDDNIRRDRAGTAGIC